MLNGLLFIIVIYRPPSQSVGVLEMGGGSTQIAFLPDHSIYANMFPVRIGGQTYHLYAHSYLSYGQNYIVSRINDYLVALQSKLMEVNNPCMLVGGKFDLLNQDLCFYSVRDFNRFNAPAEDDFETTKAGMDKILINEIVII